MWKVYVSGDAHQALKDYISGMGWQLVTVRDQPSLGAGVSSHPDLMMCKLGVYPGSPLVTADPVPSGAYPANASYCALALDRYFIHRLDITAPPLLRAADGLGLHMVNVRQGYARCGALPVDGNSVITSDPGIARVLSGLGDVDVLVISPGHVELPGFPYGFIGGTAGRLGGTIVFNGDIDRHPDGGAIRSFISSRGLSVKSFPGLPLVDIGSIIVSGPEI